MVLLAVAAFFSRYPKLEERPLHTDEAVHMVKAGILLETGRYDYNPQEYHGPTLYYFAMPFLWLTGAHSIAEVRSAVPFLLVSLLFGAGIPFLFLFLRKPLGNIAAITAAALALLSPAFAFYSRYYIQEIVLIFFTTAVLVCGVQYMRHRSIWWAFGVGVFSGFALATKESFAIIAFAMLVAGMGVRLYVPRHERELVNQGRRRFSFGLGGEVDERHVLAGLLAAIFTALFLLTTFFTNLNAVAGAVQSYGHYVYRAITGDSSTHGVGLHNHPWSWYLKNLLWFRNAPGPWWSEGIIVVLAHVGIIAALRELPASRRSGADAAELADHYFRCFIGFYTIIITCIFSALSYKTPWNVLPMLHAMILAAGVGVSSLLRSRGGRNKDIVVMLLLGAAALHLAIQNYRANFVYQADTRNPYVYAGTSPDALRLAERVHQLSDLHIDKKNMVIHVISPRSDYWPLPWYLREFRNVGYWESMPKNMQSEPLPVVITNSDLDEAVSASLKLKHHQEYFGLRPDVLMTLYAEQSLWDAFIKTR